MSALSFDIERHAENSRARAGVIHTPHGDIRTPAFSPVGTKATVKGVLPGALTELGAEVVLANTYHLYLQPGEALVREAGGIADFMGWGGPTITDSGGFQVFSLGAAFNRKVSKFADEAQGEMSEKEDQMAVYDESVASQHGQLAVIDDEGVTFTSHLDGSLHRFTPERSIEIQHDLGADIFFAFDECTAPDEPREYQLEAMRRTHRWAERSLKAHRQDIDAAKRQAIFGIVQGGRHTDLRAESARAIAEMGFDGVGIGGSFSKEDMRGALQAAIGELPAELPKHFLGIGEPGDVLEGIANGIDLFDCVAPTRLGRHGTIYTPGGLLHLTNEKCRSDLTPLSALEMQKSDLCSSGSLTSAGMGAFTVAYVAHLLRSGEILGATIASMHNLQFILSLVKGARQAILDRRFDEYRADFTSSYYG